MVAKNILISLSIVILITPECRKDPHIVDVAPISSGCPDDSCENLTPPGPPGSTEVIDDQYIIQGVQYFSPCFNPLNSDEFIYTRIGAAPQPELVKYNIANKQENVLVYPMSLGRADWGEQGWIIFVYTNSEVWKIRDDGTQLTPVSTEEIGYSPEFGNDGHYFMTNGYLTTSTAHYRPIFDLDGNLVDSSQFVFEGNVYTGYPYLSLDQKYGTGFFKFSDHDLPIDYRSGFCRKNPDGTITPLISNISGSNIRYMAANSGSIYYSEFEGPLRKIDLANNSVSVLKSGCSTRYYDYISMSAAGDKLLVEKVTQKRLDYYTVDVQHDIWLLDLNSCEALQILSGD